MTGHLGKSHRSRCEAWLRVSHLRPYGLPGSLHLDESCLPTVASDTVAKLRNLAELGREVPQMVDVQLAGSVQCAVTSTKQINNQPLV